MNEQTEQTPNKRARPCGDLARAVFHFRAILRLYYIALCAIIIVWAFSTCTHTTTTSATRENNMQNNAAAQKQEKQEKKQNTLQKYLQDKLQNINATMQQEQKTKYQWYIKITGNNKYLHFTKKTKELLQDYGVQLEQITPYTYIKYSDAPSSYNNVLNIFKACPDIFKQKVQE